MKINKLFTLLICFVMLGNASIGQQASEEMLVVFKRNTDIIADKYKQQLTAFKNCI